VRDKKKQLALLLALGLSIFGVLPLAGLVCGLIPATPTLISFAIADLFLLISGILYLTYRLRQATGIYKRAAPEHWIYQALRELEEWDGVFDSEVEEALRKGQAPPPRYY
jgi:hypothetical protein